MSYPRIQQVLAAENMFAAQLANKDTEVTTRSGEKVMWPALVVNVYTTMKAAGCNMQSVPRMTVLAAAARLASGEPVPVVVPEPVPEPAPKAAQKAAQAKPVAPKPLQSTTKPVVVTTTRPGEKPKIVEPVVDSETIQRYQCAVAGAQLLAALHQLFEKDDGPGHELRKKKLDDLIDDVERASSASVNYSVKAIIRDKNATK